ncbi:glycine/D-amino acid oxidase-like deaminating enzyme [Dyadobacter jejuensis]|uniref:Glycine/D-amino acid oxidase-like deaminating enzyme n=1 Tax=Dyadobacter jejuensis TaxID=1082580 RepID=A0A316APX3_9BACT|nr:FAD-dependent oxidoreductase [Dyadobacter jejuensis]PWJ59538.1 glycine/D-amino acid oxidase-like deaminating enzyme [Dyadobacter jejuensis]
MDLLSGQPWWLYKNGFSFAYPAPGEVAPQEVVVMGGGITGALMTYYLTEQGIPVTVLEKRHIGMGSTSGSTALLQYEIDTMLVDLIDIMGVEKAERSYALCIEAIGKVQAIVQKLGGEVDFELKKSLYYASFKKDEADLKREYDARKKMGIRVDWWDKKELKDHFPHLPHTAAILSDDAAQVDVYQLTHALFQYCVSKGAKVYDTVKVQQIEHHKKGVKLVLDNDQEIKTQKLVIACGYESQNYLSQRVVRLHASYAIVSKPMPLENPLWYENALVWESARPYLYMRTTADQRMLIGGKDETFSSAVKRDKLMARKSRELEKNARKFFPDLPFTTDYSWCGTFAETKDGLPYIGSVQEHPNTYFALGFGGNGILFSILAAQIISDQIRGIDNKDATLFAFDR